MSIKLSATIWQEGKQFVSLCLELGVASCGENPRQNCQVRTPDR